jgi:hypothetical protein
MNNEVLMSGFGINNGANGCAVTVAYEDNVITFTVGSKVKQALNNPRITDNGKSIGERNIEWLHEKLDDWINKQLGNNI